jgi:hypothetical protein
MPRMSWKLTQKIIGEPELDEHGDGTPVFGLKMISLLEELARDPANGLTKLAPGVYRGPKPP